MNHGRYYYFSCRLPVIFTMNSGCTYTSIGQFRSFVQNEDSDILEIVERIRTVLSKDTGINKSAKVPTL